MHYIIIIIVNLGQTAIETLAMIQQVFSEQSLGLTEVFMRHARFEAGHPCDIAKLILFCGCQTFAHTTRVRHSSP